MSILINSSVANPTTEIWLSSGSSLTGSMSEVMGFTTATLTTTNVPYAVGASTFLSSLTKGATIDGWVKFTPGSVYGLSIYISSDSGGDATGCNIVTLTTSSGVVNAVNLSSLQCPSVSSSNAVYLFFKRTSGVADTVTCSGGRGLSIAYSSMPTNSGWTLDSEPVYVLGA